MIRCAAASIVALFLSATAAAENLAPEESVKRMSVPPEFTVELVASEPLVRQPVAIEFDDRERLWVIQYLQYPNPAGLKRVEVDRYSRTVYDRVPKPPPHGPRGADRVTILIDTDGDGRADDTRDFVDGLNLTSSLAFGHGGVFILNVPYLLFYPDRDRNDVPDADPEVKLTGFGMQDAHAVANSLTWGPDGWLYSTQGSTVTSVIRGIEFQQGVWRYHPLTDEFELFCEGGGNSWGIDFDLQGQMLYATNYGGYVMLHGVQGAYYWKSFIKHGALHNPYAYGYFDHVPHKNFRGGHVEVGGTLYYGDTFPAGFRGKYIAADLLGHAVYWHNVERRGSTFRAEYAGDLLVANHQRFAPTDVTLGPDGAIYVTDWHDQRTAHPDPDADWDRTNGRIYRIQATAAKQTRPVDLNTADLKTVSSRELVSWLTRTNDWYVRRARRILAERRDASVHAELKKMALGKTENGALQGLWALYVSGGLDESAMALFDHPSEDVRTWCIRLFGDARRVSPRVASRLVDLARVDESVRVRSQLASTAKRLSADTGLRIVATILRRDEDAADPYLPLLLWWAVEAHAVRAIDLVEALLIDHPLWKRQITRETILPRLMRRYAAEGSARTLRACANLLSSAPDPQAREVMLVSLDQGLSSSGRVEGVGKGSLFLGLGVSGAGSRETSERTVVRPPPQLEEQLLRLWQETPGDPTLIRVLVRLGKDAAHDRALALALSPETEREARLSLFRALAELGRASCSEPLLERVGGKEPDWVQLAAIDVLARFDDERISKTILERYSSFNDKLRARARSLLLGRATSTRAFLEAVDEGRFDPKMIPADDLRRVALYEDADLDALVGKHWGRIASGTPEEKLAEMRRLNNDLRAGSGHETKGKEIFKKLCSNCHVLFDEGAKIGPELTTANRQDRAFLMASLVDPNRTIRREYVASVIITQDGRVLTGLVVEESPSSITLVDAKAERTTVPRSVIAEIQDAPTSLMPENLIKEIKPQELRDLFAYLQATR